MKLIALTDLVAGLEAFEPLHGLTSGRVRAYGLLNAAHPAAVAALALRRRPLLLVTPHPQAAADLVEELRFWTGARVALFPALESLPYERVHLDRAILAERESAAGSLATGEVEIVVAPARAVLQPIVKPRVEAGPRMVRAGDHVQPEALLRDLVALGYAESSVVDEPGTFARRGGVVDIYPAGASAPFRLDFFGNEVESIRTFDVVSQRSTGSVDAFEVHPVVPLDEDTRLAALEALMDADLSTLNAEAQTAWQHDLARLEAGASLDELPLFAPYLVAPAVSILSCVPDGGVVVLEDADEVRSLFGELIEQAREVQRGMEEAGDLPRGLRPALLSADEIEGVLAELPSIELVSGSVPLGDEGAVDLSGVFLPAPLYAGRLRSFVHDLESGPKGRGKIDAARDGGTGLTETEDPEGTPSLPADRSWEEAFRQGDDGDPEGAPQFAPTVGCGEPAPAWRTVIASRQPDRVVELLAEHEILPTRLEDLLSPPEPGVSVLPDSPSEGWTLPSRHLTLLTDHELFGRARVRPIPRRRRAARESFFAAFQPGDYVVHLEHGIGRFDGVVRMTVDGAEREFALVQYAGADRVYVPTDQLERLTKYIGVGETPPPLNKLGGGEWQRARARAKKAAEDIAQELLDIYSKRMARPGFAYSPDTPWQRELEQAFPFEETPDQLRTVDDVKLDMEAARPMDRLVCADVGYGKTEVAVRAAFKALMDGRQVAVLVPTTILAQQHYETFRERLASFPVRVEALSRFRTRAEQAEILRGLEAGQVDVVIGTHRILQRDVKFKDLGLLIIDEEQRFGVKHKEQLKKLRETVDVLTLTATPIPRTLHMTLVGIREVSVIETPPEGRLPVRTYLQPFDERLVREAILRELDRDGQVYFVHNKVAAIDSMAERVRRLVPEARVLVAHGQMDESQLEKVMTQFSHHEADVLLCSTIIENGLDIPNVNTIVVSGAHRLGLTQLYQLRGRVGRSANQAYAYLLYPRDAQISHDARRRMEAVFEAQDLGAGFSIAMKDLEIRGAGNLLGAEQSGHAAAVGFDLYTRMVGEAIEALRGTPVEEQPSVSIDLPMTMYLPAEYIANEPERLTLYRRLAAVRDADGLEAIAAEIRDRFGAPPIPVENLLSSVRIKLLAIAAGVTAVSLGPDYLTVRAAPTGVFDRVSLYRNYGMEARISTNVLRIPRESLGVDVSSAVRDILTDMARLRQSLRESQPVGV